jgi:hypothetical protein
VPGSQCGRRRLGRQLPAHAVMARAVNQRRHVSHRMIAAVPATAYLLPRLGWGVVGVVGGGTLGPPAVGGAFAAEDLRILAAQGDCLHMRAGFWVTDGEPVLLVRRGREREVAAADVPHRDDQRFQRRAMSGRSTPRARRFDGV